jgi:hypothetical protein
MANNNNSSRSLLKATYVPVKIPVANVASSAAASAAPQPNVMMKVAYLRGLNIRPDEMEALHNSPKLKKIKLARLSKTNIRKAIPGQALTKVTEAVTNSLSPGLMSTHGALLAKATTENLQSLGRELHEIRQQKVNTVSTALKTVTHDYAKHIGSSPELVTHTDALQWAAKAKHPALIDLQQTANSFSLQTASKLVTSPEQLSLLLKNLIQQAAATKTLIDDFLLSFSFQPAGWLHLERLEMNPVDIEDGELVYSVPLTPKETVNITHREWSQSTTTFETLVSDSFEGFSEKGVTEKTDVATALGSETKHSSAFDVNGQVSFSYSGNPYSVTTSAGVNYSTKADDSRSVKDSQAHSLAITQMASARTRKEHKQSFRVSSVAGSQDLSVRTLTNPSDSQTMRADYFRMMRRWQVDLIRYGLRMTYDLVIPNPGYALAGKILELMALNANIAADYKFDVSLADISPDTWQDYAQSLGADVDPPPAPVLQMMQSGPLTKSIDTYTFSTLMFNIPDGYVVTAGQFSAQVHIGDGDYNSGHRAQVNLLGEGGSGQFTQKDGLYTAPLTQNSVVQRTGDVALMYLYYNVESGGYIARIEAAPTPDALLAWKVKVLNQLRDAGKAAYDANVQKMKDRKSQLEDEIANYDSLTLRRMEREEIMRLVLQWIFGPTFQLVPTLFEQLVWPDYLVNQPVADPTKETAFPDPADITADWDTVRKYGEFIKFLNNAIEWENVLFFCYPYFWDLVENWPFKRFLVHDDPDHRAFFEVRLRTRSTYGKTGI